MTSSNISRETLPLADIMRDYAPAWGDDWEIFFKHEDDATGELIRRLAAELEAHGSFDEPVTLCAESTDYDEETGETEVYPACIGNGMHRLAAHRLTGIDPVFVQYGWEDFDEEAYDADSSLHVVFRPLAPWNTDEEFEQFDAIHELLSWRHQGPGYHRWLRVGSGGGQLTPEGGYWDLFFEEPDTYTPSLDLQVLREDIVSRIGHLATVLEVKWESNREEDYDEDDAS